MTFNSDPSRVGQDDNYQATIHWLRKVHGRSKLAVAVLEEIYFATKRRKITPEQARERVRTEVFDAFQSWGQI
jgi:hypothetical protein